MTRQFWIDLIERAIKTFFQSIAAFFSAGAFNVVEADWGEALTIGASAAVLSIITSLASLKIGNQGTASMTKAVRVDETN